MDIHEALNYAKLGRALLFTGAGFSIGAKNSLPDDLNEIPTASHFAKILAQALDSSNEYPLQVVSQSYIRRFGASVLANEMAKRFSIVDFQRFHRIVAEIPWRRVYTTNYDNLFEVASNRSGRNWRPITTDEPVVASQEIAVHINGYITNLNAHTLSQQVKLTHSSYSADNFANSKWSEQLRQDANIAKAVFFVGYSMSDLDIARVFFQNPLLKERTFFIVSQHDDDIAIAPLEEYGSVLRIGTQEFARLLENTAATVVNSPHQYTWLHEYEQKARSSAPDDKSAIDFILKGQVDSSSISWSMAAAETIYCVKRKIVDQILGQVRSGKKWFVLHSDLGNGKSIVKEQLSIGLSQLGYRVFWDSDFENHKLADLRTLPRETGQIAILLDSTTERFEAIDGLLQINLPNIAVFVLVRTTLYELGETAYSDRLPDDYLAVDLNKLEDDDIRGFVRLFNRLGLWTSRAKALDDEKFSFIKITCSGAISRLIVASFEESEIGQRIKRAAEGILNARTELSSIIVASFVVNKIGHTPTPELLSSIVNLNVRSLMNSPSFSNAGEFVRFHLGTVIIRSSIISDYLLRTSISPEILIWHVENFVKRLSQIKREPALQHIFLELQRLPVIFGMVGKRASLSRQKEKDVVIGYFQSISELPFCQKNALFWVHYGMARLEYGEYGIASIYLEQAREFAKDSPSLLRDVDNHYARLLLDSRVKSENYNDHFRAFEQAHNILIKQMNRDTNARHFPYRQAAKYLDFVAHRKDHLTSEEKAAFVSACKQVQSAIANTRGQLAKSVEIEKCTAAMQRAIEIANS